MSTSTEGLHGAGTGNGNGNGNNQNSNSNNNGGASPLEDFHLSASQLISLLDSKDDALQVLKSDLMDALNKGVKSLDEDSWMFEGPRSRINLISNPGGPFATRNCQSSNQLKFGLLNALSSTPHGDSEAPVSLCGLLELFQIRG